MTTRCFMDRARKSSLAPGTVRSTEPLGREYYGAKANGNQRSQNFYSMDGGPRTEPLAGVLHVHVLYFRHVSDARRNRQFRPIAGVDCVCQATAPCARFQISRSRQIAWSGGANSLYHGRRNRSPEALLRSKRLCSSVSNSQGAAGNQELRSNTAARLLQTCAGRQIRRGLEDCCRVRGLGKEFGQSGNTNGALFVNRRGRALAAIQRVRARGTKRVLLDFAQRAAIQARCKTLCQTHGGSETVAGNRHFKTS